MDGPKTVFNFGTNDGSAPGQGAIERMPVQDSNTHAVMQVRCPSSDVVGPLTKLRGFNHCYANGPDDPFTLASYDDIKAMPNYARVPLTDADAGVLKDVDVPILDAGANQWGVFWFDDNT